MIGHLLYFTFNTKNMNTKNDELVLQLIAKVKQKKSEISAAQKPKWETSCTFSTDPDNVQSRVNLQTVTDINKLIDIYAFLLFKEEYYNVAAECLKVSTKGKYMGYSFADWKKDVHARVDQVNINSKKRDLETLEARLDKLVTPEQRRDIELEAIQKELAAEG